MDTYTACYKPEDYELGVLEEPIVARQAFDADQQAADSISFEFNLVGNTAATVRSWTKQAVSAKIVKRAGGLAVKSTGPAQAWRCLSRIVATVLN